MDSLGETLLQEHVTIRLCRGYKQASVPQLCGAAFLRQIVKPDARSLRANVAVLAAVEECTRRSAMVQESLKRPSEVSLEMARLPTCEMSYLLI